MNKSIHIVFQVLNFLSNPNESSLYNLSSDEKLLLLMLAKHKGEKGIYPSVGTLMKELQKSDSAVRRSLQRLAQKKLISIRHNLGKSSHYELNINVPTPGVHATPSVQEPLASTLGHPRRPRGDTPSVHARQYNTNNKTDINTERARPTSAPALSFEPDKENTTLCQRLGLSLMNEVESFLNRFKGTKSQYEFERWIKRSAEYQSRQGQKEKTSTVPEWGAGHPSYDELHKVKAVKETTVIRLTQPNSERTPHESIVAMKAFFEQKRVADAERLAKLKEQYQLKHGELNHDITTCEVPRNYGIG